MRGAFRFRGILCLPWRCEAPWQLALPSAKKMALPSANENGAAEFDGLSLPNANRLAQQLDSRNRAWASALWIFQHAAIEGA
jgi:hypothetical protein